MADAEREPAATNARVARRPTDRARARGRLARQPHRHRRRHPQRRTQDLPGPLELPARRDRAVRVRDPRRDRDLHDLLLHARRARDDLPGPVRGDGRPADVGRLRVGDAAVVRGPVGAAHAPGPPLDRARVPRRDRRPPRSHLLHRRVPAAARDQLADRARPAAARAGGGDHRLFAPGRPPVRDGAPDHRLGHAVDPVRRPVGRVAVLRRRVPDARHPQPPVRVPRDAAAGPADRGHRRPPRARCGCRSTPSTARRGPARTTSSGCPSGRGRSSGRSGCSS